MKAAIYILFGLLVVFNAKAQQNYTYHHLAFNPKDSFAIEVSKDKKGEVSMYINAYSIDKLSKEGGFTINSKQYPGFINAMISAKAKYLEWMKTAKDNNVTNDMIKKMENITSKSGGFFYYGKEWRFQFNVDLEFSFQIFKTESEVYYNLLVTTGELTASDNQFMKNDGFYLIFKSIEDIDTFLSKISMDKVKAFLDKPDLFKN